MKYEGDSKPTSEKGLVEAMKQAGYDMRDLKIITKILHELEIESFTIKNGVDKERMRRAYLFVGAYFGWL